MRTAAATTSTGDDLPDLGAVKIPREGTPAAPRLRRQGEARRLLHVTVQVDIAYQVGKVVGRGVARGLSEPEHCLTAGALGRAVVPGELQESRPDSDRIRQGRREDRLF